MSAVEWAARVINTLTLIVIVVAVGAPLLCALKLLADVVWQKAVATYDRWDDRRWERRAFPDPHRSRWQP